MVSRTAHICLLVLLNFSLIFKSIEGTNTTQFDNFTIEWQTFTIFTCGAQSTLNVSAFTCSSTENLSVDDVSCLTEITMDFNQATCQMTTNTAIYTTETPITTQQIQTSTATAAITTQRITTANVVTTTASNTVADTITTRSIQTSSGSITSATRTSTVTAVSSTTTQTASIINGAVSTTTATMSSASSTTVNPFICMYDEYIGTYCNVSSDACSMSDPCFNDATCYSNNSFPYGYFCLCQTGYTGYNCQYDQRACKENTCWHNGTCIAANTTITANNGSNFTCECVAGYDGVYCQFQIDLCANITCENRGVCTTVDLTWECLCLDPTLYYGQYCQYKTNKLKLLEILSKSFASIAIAAIIVTCGFIIIMDILKYCFHIDPVEYERDSYQRRKERRRQARRGVKNHEPKLALRFQYVS